MGDLETIDLGRDLPAALHDGVVLGRAGFVEQRRDLIVRHGVDAIDSQQRRLPAKRLDLLHEPLKEFGCLRGFGKNPGSSTELHRAHALQLPPDADAMAGRRGRQTHE